MHRGRSFRGAFAVAFGVGLIVASCCSDGAVIFILALLIIGLGLSCAGRS